MGAGKSTVGRLLAPLLGWRFLDVDAVLTERWGASVAALFENHGEAWFREREAGATAELLAHEEAVIALGGGAVEHPGTRAVLAATPDTLIVYLEAPLALALARCAGEPGAAVRPILEDAALLERRFHTRLPLYQAAHLTVPTEGRAPAELAALIRDALLRQTQK